MNEMMNGFHMAVERGKRFHAELKTADPAMAAQLLGAWKELIMGEMVKLLQATNDPKYSNSRTKHCTRAGRYQAQFGVIAGGKR
jgi:hypothetical protein